MRRWRSLARHYRSSWLITQPATSNLPSFIHSFFLSFRTFFCLKVKPFFWSCGLQLAFLSRPGPARTVLSYRIVRVYSLSISLFWCTLLLSLSLGLFQGQQTTRPDRHFFFTKKQLMTSSCYYHRPLSVAVVIVVIASTEAAAAPYSFTLLISNCRSSSSRKAACGFLLLLLLLRKKEKKQGNVQIVGSNGQLRRGKTASETLKRSITQRSNARKR